MNEKVKTLIDELAAEFNFTPEYLISLCQDACKNIYKKDLEDFIDVYYNFTNDEEYTIAAVLVLAEAGMLKELIRLKSSKPMTLIDYDFIEKSFS